ncbi:YfhO family protein [Patescibacteria group bacterium]
MSWLSKIRNNQGKRWQVLSAWPLFFIFLASVLFFWNFFIEKLLPVPSDTVVGMYHPWRDVIWDNFSSGVPFKNFLITDPVRQQIPWRMMAVNLFKNSQIPFWNPYVLSGTPLLANFQSAVFYPLNFIFFLLPFNFAWGVLVFLQPVLAGSFLYLYLKNLKLKPFACLIGSLSFSFSGFFIAWLEWGTVLHAALWLPLVLLSVDKIIAKIISSKTNFHQNFHTIILDCIIVKWGLVFVLSLVFSLLAGHLQTTFYLIIFSATYLFWRLRGINNCRRKIFSLFIILYSLFLVFSFIQWQPTFELIRLSAREIDQVGWQASGWFIPWQHLVQFFAPDFFGNPATLNYWGQWNYGEFVGYLGVIPLALALFGIWGCWNPSTLFRMRKFGKEAKFFGIVGLAALSFALPTFWAKLPYRLNIPFLSTAQPTRLLFLVDFSLAVLAAFGTHRLMSDSAKKKKKEILGLLGILGGVYVLLWVFVWLAPNFWPQAEWILNLPVSKRNLILPTAIFGVFGVALSSCQLASKNNKSLITNYPGFFKSRGFSTLIGRNYLLITLIAVLGLTTFDLFRFGWKFTPFSKQEWLFPSTKVIEFLQNDDDIYRVMATDRRLMPPNFSIAYKLQTIDGYDPLYLRSYGELISASERGEPNISPPFGFNRIITPQRYDSRVIDLLNVKYVLSLTDLNSQKLELVFQEGETRVYQNSSRFPRAFMVYDYRLAQNRQQAINLLMDRQIDLSKTVILEEQPEIRGLIPGVSQVNLLDYAENHIQLTVESDQSGILVLTDANYPGWQAEIDHQPTRIYTANYHFRAIIVPEGKHQVLFKYGKTN